jgi:hypothetical protein
MTMLYHEDDCKLSHRDPKVLDRMILWLRWQYECIFEGGSGEMKVSRGKVHKYVVMTVDFTKRGILEISMFGYVEEILATFDEADTTEGGAKTSATTEDFFKIDEDSEKLGEVIRTLRDIFLYQPKTLR